MQLIQECGGVGGVGRREVAPCGEIPKNIQAEAGQEERDVHEMLGGRALVHGAHMREEHVIEPREEEKRADHGEADFMKCGRDAVRAGILHGAEEHRDPIRRAIKQEPSEDRDESRDGGRGEHAEIVLAQMGAQGCGCGWMRHAGKVCGFYEKASGG